MRTAEDYLLEDGTLLDYQITQDLLKARAMYMDGAILEARDILCAIAKAIKLFEQGEAARGD